MSEYEMTPLHLLAHIGHIHHAHVEPKNTWALLERNGSLGIAKVAASEDEKMRFEDMLEFCQYLTGVSDAVYWYDDPLTLAENVHDLTVCKFDGQDAADDFHEYLNGLQVEPPQEGQIAVDLRPNGENTTLVIRGPERTVRKVRDLLASIANRSNNDDEVSDEAT